MNKTKIILLSVLVLFTALNSCVTQRACQRHYPAKNDTIRIETVRDSIVVKDTTIYIHLPAEIVVDSFPIPCPPPPPSYVPKKVCAETSLATACAWWSYPNIKLELIQKDTTIEKRLEGALKEAYHWKSEYEKITVTPAPVKFIPGVYRVAFWMWIFVIVSVAGYFVLKIFVFKK